MPLSLVSWSDSCIVLAGFREYGYGRAYLRDGFRVYPPQKNVHKCKCGCDTPTVEKTDRPHGRYRVHCWKCGASTPLSFQRRDAVSEWNGVFAAGK